MQKDHGQRYARNRGTGRAVLISSCSPQIIASNLDTEPPSPNAQSTEHPVQNVAIEELKRNLDRTQFNGFHQGQFRFEEENEWAGIAASNICAHSPTDLIQLDLSLSRLSSKSLLGLGASQVAEEKFNISIKLAPIFGVSQRRGVDSSKISGQSCDEFAVPIGEGMESELNRLLLDDTEISDSLLLSPRIKAQQSQGTDTARPSQITDNDGWLDDLLSRA
jgi:hypothetical protein